MLIYKHISTCVFLRACVCVTQNYFSLKVKWRLIQPLNLNIRWSVDGCSTDFTISASLSVTIKSMLNVVYAECRYAECRYAECHYAECHVCWMSCMLNVVMLNVVMLNVVMLSVVMLNDVIPSVVMQEVVTSITRYTKKFYKFCLKYVYLRPRHCTLMHFTNKRTN